MGHEVGDWDGVSGLEWGGGERRVAKLDNNAADCIGVSR